MLPPVAYHEELQQAGIPVDNLRMRRKIPDPRALFRLAHIVREWHPDVVHAHMIHANLLARIARLLTPIPVLICTAHNINEGGWLRERAYQLTDWLCDLTTQVSRAGLERYVRVKAVPPHKILYIPNGVDLSRFMPHRERHVQRRKELGFQSAFLWLSVGRMEPQKAYPTMLQAFHRVLQHHPDTRLIVIGDGSLRPIIEQQITQLGLNKAVQLLGIRRDVPEWMQIADGYVMSSAWEGLPIVLLEAHASGLPIVCTDVGGCAEIVLHGKTGFVVPPGDANALAQAMIQLMNLPADERRAMGDAGSTHVMANFEIEQVVSRWEALYCEWIERKTRR
jgi:glycosyltransferase involved in cell wall biosynthesis